jgi:hypothetical protein
VVECILAPLCQLVGVRGLGSGSGCGLSEEPVVGVGPVTLAPMVQHNHGVEPLVRINTDHDLGHTSPPFSHRLEEHEEGSAAASLADPSRATPRTRCPTGGEPFASHTPNLEWAARTQANPPDT